MAYSNLIHNCSRLRLRAIPLMAAATTTSVSLQLYRRFHLNKSPFLLRTTRPPHRFHSCGFCCSAAIIRRRNRNASSPFTLPYIYQQNFGFGRLAYPEYPSESESDREFEPESKQLNDSTLGNIEEWRWKLTMLLRNENEQEVISREKKDRRDFGHLSALATRMGLHCCQFDKVVVFSKVPLPNYRPDLDSKRPQREVVLPHGLQDRVNALLKAYCSKKSINNTSSEYDHLHISVRNSPVPYSPLTDAELDLSHAAECSRHHNFPCRGLLGFSVLVQLR